MSYRCKIINTQRDFLNYRRQWNRLVERSSSCSFFLGWEWLDTWLTVYGNIVDRLFIIIVINQEGELVGAMPLYLLAVKHHSVFNRQLRFIGTGEEEWEEVATEYLDIVSLPETEEKVCRLLYKALQDFELDWILLTVENVLESSVLVNKFLPVLSNDKYRLIKNKSGQRYRIDLPESWDEYEAGLGKSMRRKIRQSRKRISQLEDQKTEVFNNIEVGFSELKRLHEERWKKKNMPGAFSSPKFIAFHREFMARLLDEGKLRLRRTTMGTDLIAILYNIRFADTEYYYQSGFDLQLGSRIRPGIYAHVRAIEESIKEKVAYYDLMKGDENSYKSEYCAQKESMLTIRLYNRSMKGRFLYLRDTLLEYVRKLRDQAITN